MSKPEPLFSLKTLKCTHKSNFGLQVSFPLLMLAQKCVISRLMSLLQLRVPHPVKRWAASRKSRLSHLTAASNKCAGYEPPVGAEAGLLLGAIYVNTTQLPGKVGVRRAGAMELLSSFPAASCLSSGSSTGSTLCPISSNFGLDVAPLDGPGGRGSDGCHHCPLLAGPSCTRGKHLQDSVSSRGEQWWGEQQPFVLGLPG